MCDFVLVGKLGAQFAALSEAARCQVRVRDGAVLFEVVEALSMADEVNSGGHSRFALGDWLCGELYGAV